MSKAKGLLYRSIQLSRSLHLNTGLAASYSQMIPLQMNSGMPDSAAYYLGLLQPLSAMFPGTVIDYNYNFSSALFYKLQGNYKAGLTYSMKALRIQTKRLNSGDLPSDDVVETLKFR